MDIIDKLRVFQREYLKKIKNRHYKRYLYKEINFNGKLFSIVGARGVGKTTLLLQYLRESPFNFSQKLYVSVDILGAWSLFDIAFEFHRRGGKLIIFDEIHKYDGFEKELKNIYDMLDLKVVFSGSSALKLDFSKGDLSRRATVYNMQGLSFREFLEMKHKISLQKITLQNILENHIDLADELLLEFNLYSDWNEYLKYGYYPFYFENKEEYHIKLASTINAVIESDIPSIFPIEYSNIILLKKLIFLICSSNPYKPNMKNLLDKMNLKNDYNRLYRYMFYLYKGKIINLAGAKSRGDGILSKPEKIYLNNTNLHYAYCDNPEIGTIREVFFYSMLFSHKVLIPKKGDFLVDDKFTFEIGGKNKTKKQIKGIENSYTVLDDIEIGGERKIPLWLFGFLY